MRGFLAGLALLLSLLLPSYVKAQENEPMRIAEPIIKPSQQPKQEEPIVEPIMQPNEESIIEIDSVMKTDSLSEALAKEMKHFQDSVRKDSLLRAEYGKVRDFKPDPNRAMWLSLLCPGLGQVYNRRYWKLPIVVGGFVGFGYAISWNNSMLQDYTKAYRDAMDNDPTTKSYMDLYPPNYKEENIDMAWLKRTLKAKKDFYRRNKEMCVIGLVAMYGLCVIDAYVDASLMQFDISEDLSMKVKPAVMEPNYVVQGKLPQVGVQCAFRF